MKIRDLFLAAFKYVSLRKELHTALEKILSSKEYDKGDEVIVFMHKLPIDAIYYFLCKCDAEKQMIPLIILYERDLMELNWIQLVYIRSRAKMCMQYFGENFVLPKLCEKVTKILENIKPDYA